MISLKESCLNGEEQMLLGLHLCLWLEFESCGPGG